MNFINVFKQRYFICQLLHKIHERILYNTCLKAKGKPRKVCILFDFIIFCNSFNLKNRENYITSYLKGSLSLAASKEFFISPSIAKSSSSTFSRLVRPSCCIFIVSFIVSIKSLLTCFSISISMIPFSDSFATSTEAVR